MDGLGEGALRDTRVSLLFSERCFYIIRASFSQERMTYIKEESKVSYQSKDGKEEKVFDALEWVVAMCSHVPNKGESRCSGSQIRRLSGSSGAIIVMFH